MTYPNIHTATKALSRKLHTFAGHQVDACHTSFCFDQLARAIDHINGERAARSVNFIGEIYADGKALPVLITVEGKGLFQPVTVTIQHA